MGESILHPAVAAALAHYGMDYRVIECDPQYADTAAFCAHYGLPPGEGANTIIVASKTDPVRYAACIVLPTTKLDVNKCVRQLLGCRLSFASAEQTEALTHMQIGGVVAVGLPEEVPVFIDAAVFAQPEVLMGGGNRSSKLTLDPHELLKMPQAQRIQGLGVAHSPASGTPNL
jgi:prolyl-tRNA editing enzyme YbaK/EbsC (Cys-tRNA(Pro) deacylase)